MIASPERGATGAVDLLFETLVERRRARFDRLLVAGICGAQGSGKSTLAASLEARLEQSGLRVATLSLDDLYLPRSARIRLAAEVHPLLATRGVPGTHDIMLWDKLISDLDAGRPLALARFDKAADDRAPLNQWPLVGGELDILLFEGWCVGAVPQARERLDEPVNDLERNEDGDGAWRRFVNSALAGPYRAMFERIDLQILLAAPGFAVVAGWRIEQEHALRRQLDGQGADTSGLMDDAAIGRFVSHYQRLTQHILEEMPGRADLAIRLDPQRRMLSASRRSG